MGVSTIVKVCQSSGRKKDESDPGSNQAPHRLGLHMGIENQEAFEKSRPTTMGGTFQTITQVQRGTWTHPRSAALS